MTMETPAEIDFQGMAPNVAVSEDVRQHLAELESRFGRITAGRVVIKGPGEHHQRGGLYEVASGWRCRTSATSTSPARRRTTSAMPTSPMPSAMPSSGPGASSDADVRQLERQVKHHDPAPAGRVARIDPSDEFGFIATVDGREIYFHRNSVLNGGFGRLKPGTAVAFAEEDGEKESLASTVRSLGKHLVP